MRCGGIKVCYDGFGDGELVTVYAHNLDALVAVFVYMNVYNAALCILVTLFLG